MSNPRINTIAIQNFMNQVKAAEVGRQPEVKMDLMTAKALSHTLGLVMTRLAGDYEGLLTTTTEVQQTVMDGGTWD